jgi:subtilase family serine protease
MLLALMAAGLGSAFAGHADAATVGLLSKPLITQAANDNDRVTIPGNVSPYATAENDRGLASDSLPLEHILIQLKRPTEREQALQQFMHDQQTPGSANYRKWLTSEEFGQQYGVSQLDIDAITGWLKSHGFTVNQVYPSGMMIDITGNAGLVRHAFNTEIHHLRVADTDHIANMTDPQIPAAFASVVEGVVSLNDFRPHTNSSSMPTTPSRVAAVPTRRWCRRTSRRSTTSRRCSTQASPARGRPSC